MEEEPDTLENRAKGFMQSYDIDDIKRRKEETEVELRKSKRADLVTKRRNLEQTEKQWVKINELFRQNYTIKDLPELLTAMKSNQDDQSLLAAQGFRKVLSLEHDPPIQDLIDAGILPYLIEWIQKFDFPQLQYESSWTITNIASGTHHHCQVIVEKGCVPLLIQMMTSSNEEVREQAVWALGNIGGDAAHCRDIILQNQGLPLLIKCLQTSSKHSMIKNASWAISNLCRGKPGPIYEMVKDAMPVLADVVIKQHDPEILSDALWALSHLSEGSEEKIDALISTQVVPRAIQLLNHHLYNIQLPAIRLIGNIVTGTEAQTQLVINLGGVEALSTLLNSSKKNTQKEAVWSISNICAGNKEQLDRLISADVMPRLVACAYSSDKEIKKETVWALSNAAAGSKPEQLAKFVQSGIIQALCSLFDENDVKIVSVALEGLNRVLKCGKENFMNGDINQFASIVEQCNGLHKLEKLQQHPTVQIYEKARNMIENYFQVEPDENQSLINMIKECSQFNL
jgi:importin subunit alpha-6/7